MIETHHDLMKFGEKFFAKQEINKIKDEARKAEAVKLMRELQQMSHEGKKIEKEGKMDKINNFNNLFIKKQVRLSNIIR